MKDLVDIIFGILTLLLIIVTPIMFYKIWFEEGFALKFNNFITFGLVEKWLNKH